nr:hypothetical protein [Okeania sp. SIO2C9]
MDKNKIDGKKDQVRAKETTIESNSYSRDKGIIGRNSGCSEHQSERVDRKMGEGLAPDAVSGLIGGIFDLFREIVRDALNYMYAHNGRLKQRSDESDVSIASFLDKAAALEREMAKVLEQVEQPPKNEKLEE